MSAACRHVHVEYAARTPAAALRVQVGLVFYVSRLNTHGAPGSRRRRRLALASGGQAAASPMVSFTLVQHGRDVTVTNLSEPVQLELPLSGGRSTNGTCLGRTDAAAARTELDARLEGMLGREVSLALTLAIHPALTLT